MLQLSPTESRVLSVLVEKALTVPAQYPMTLNSLTLGANQKNNRDPVTDLSEEDIYDAIDRLRAKGLVREAILSGSRVSKFRHLAREVLGVSTEELILLTELLLRGPQSPGELRTRASRMHPLASVEQVEELLRGLMQERPPATESEETRPIMVRRLSRRPGERAERYAQLLCPDLHPLDGPPPAPSPHAAAAGATGGGGDASLAARVEELERELRALRTAVTKLASAMGEGHLMDTV